MKLTSMFVNLHMDIMLEAEILQNFFWDINDQEFLIDFLASTESTFTTYMIFTVFNANQLKLEHEICAKYTQH